jgi:DNA polymerase I-like protein with 3'-5' exonuclease and polymerase domains
LKMTKNMAYRAMEEEGAVEVRNAVGFRRTLEGFNRKPTSWLNTWIQSTAQYGIKTAMRYLREARLLPFVVGQIHDEILFEFPDDFVEEGVSRAKACMIAGMRDVLGQNVPVHVDESAVGKVWL